MEEDDSNFMADSWADDQLSGRFEADPDPRDEDAERERYEELMADEAREISDDVKSEMEQDRGKI